MFMIPSALPPVSAAFLLNLSIRTPCQASGNGESFKSNFFFKKKHFLVCQKESSLAFLQGYAVGKSDLPLPFKCKLLIWVLG